jgi:prepilin-type N-terminal cleavage/methylation domain-containing protein
MTRSDDGFSIVEVVIAMFLLAILALAILPLMVGVTRTSTVNRSLVSATSFANAQIAPIRAAFPSAATGTTSCATLRSTYAKTGTAGPAGSGLQADVTIAACPTATAAYPTAVAVTASVYKSSAPTKILASLPTTVLVSAP